MNILALWRLIKNSVRFAFRAKRRWITFVIIFAFLSAFITLFVGAFNQYSTEQLLNQKGFYVKATDEGTVTEAQGLNLKTGIEALTQVEKVALFRYFDLGDYIRVYGVDPASKWMFGDEKPSFLINGKYADKQGEVIVSKNATIRADVGTILGNVSSTLQKGDLLVFENSTKLELDVVGEIDDLIFAQDKLKIFVTNPDFDLLYSDFGNGVTKYCHSLALLVFGKLYSPFDKEIYNNMIALDTPGEPLYLLVKNPTYGDWADPITAGPDVARKDRATRMLYFIFGVVGGVLLTILYNFLIVWFRRREVAVLRALGYEKGEIRINLLGESFTISLVGYIIGILSIIIYYAARGMTFTNQLLAWQTLLVSFSIVVLLTIPGLLLSSLSFVRVSPVILFKAR